MARHTSVALVHNGSLDDGQLVLMPEVQARRALQSRGDRIHVILLRPVFNAVGCGMLRVLRIRPAKGDADLEVIAGYDSYERIER